MAKKKNNTVEETDSVDEAVEETAAVEETTVVEEAAVVEAVIEEKVETTDVTVIPAKKVDGLKYSATVKKGKTTFAF